MKKYGAEFQVGIFLLIGFLCLSYVTVKLGKMDFIGTAGKTYYADFSSIAGLRAGADVEISGVHVGKVTDISLLPTQNGAKVTMLLDDYIDLTTDTIASIKTSGLIGDKYVSLSIGGGDSLASGGTIHDTEPSLDIESLISKYVFGGTK